MTIIYLKVQTYNYFRYNVQNSDLQEIIKIGSNNLFHMCLYDKSCLEGEEISTAITTVL